MSILEHKNKSPEEKCLWVISIKGIDERSGVVHGISQNVGPLLKSSKH